MEVSDFSDGTAKLVFRYIGFETQRHEVQIVPRRRLDVALQPTSVEMDEIVVTDENPTENIMRRVIEQKAIW